MIEAQTVSASDLNARIVPETNPPIVGDNVLLVTVTDRSGNPVPDANISATASTALSQHTGATESARSTGNGSYRIPIRAAVSELYIVTLRIQRTGKPDTLMKYGIRPW